jgi:AAHS family benzoate transporter-like MFS transporter
MTPRWALPVAGCFLAVGLGGYELAAYAAALPQLIRGGGLRLGEVGGGVVASAAMAGMLVGGLGAARLSRRQAPHRLLRTAVAVMAGGLLVCCLATQPWALGAGRLLSGVGAGAAVPTAISITAAVAPSSRRTVVHTVMFSGLQLGSALGALAAPGLVGQAGWRAPFGVGAGAAVALAVLLPRLLASRTGPSAAVTGIGGIGALWTAGLWRLTATHWLCTALALFAIYGLNTWLVQVMLAAGHGPGVSLRLLAVLNLGAVLGAPIAGLAADRWGQRRTVALLFALGTGALVLLAGEPSSVATPPLVGLAGLGTMGATTLLNGLTATAYPEHLRTAALGSALGVGRLGAMAGPVYGGLLLGLTGAPGTLLPAFAVPTLVTALLVATSPRPTPALMQACTSRSPLPDCSPAAWSGRSSARGCPRPGSGR